MVRCVSTSKGDVGVDEFRIALLNARIAKQRGEDFIVRSEEQELVELLDLFGFHASQVIQPSSNARFHAAMALQLLHEKKAFSCFCSDEWLENKRHEAEEKGEEYKYDDACRNLPAELVIDNTAPFRVRIAGKLSQKMESFTILNQDKTATPTFATAVDDMLHDINTVVCSVEDKEETKKQEYVRDALGYDKKIEYIYVADMVDDEAHSVKELLKAGYLPEAILDYLVSTEEIDNQENFNFSLQTLKEVNKKHLKSLDAKELSRYVGFADSEIGSLARLYLDDVVTTQELKAKIAPIFASREENEYYTKEVETLQECAKKAPYFEHYVDFKAYLQQETGIKEIEEPLRVLLTNSTESPNLEDVYMYLKNYLGEIVK